MQPAWFRSSFLRVFKFLEIKEWRSNFWGEPILQKVWIIWSHVLYFNVKSFLDHNSSPFIRSECILDGSGVIFLQLSNFYKLKRAGCKFWGEPIFRKSELFGPSVRYLNFQSSMDPNFSSFTRFQCILYDSGVLFSEFWNFYKLKRGICGEPILEKVWLIWSQFPCHSFDSNTFCMIQEYFSQSFETSTN